MFEVVLGVRLLPMAMKFPPGTIIRRYAMSCDSLIPFNCREFAVEYLSWLSFRTVSTAATSFAEVPVPLNRRIGGTLCDPGGAQAVMASDMRNETRAIASIAMGAVNQGWRGTSRVRRLAGESVFAAL